MVMKMSDKASTGHWVSLFSDLLDFHLLERAESAAAKEKPG